MTVHMTCINHSARFPNLTRAQCVASWRSRQYKLGMSKQGAVCDAVHMRDDIVAGQPQVNGVVTDATVTLTTVRPSPKERLPSSPSRGNYMLSMNPIHPAVARRKCFPIEPSASSSISGPGAARTLTLISH